MPRIIPVNLKRRLVHTCEVTNAYRSDQPTCVRHTARRIWISLFLVKLGRIPHFRIHMRNCENACALEYLTLYQSIVCIGSWRRGWDYSRYDARPSRGPLAH